VHISRAHLPSTATAEELRQLCEPYGLLDTMQIITHRDTGRCKGLGFIEMPDSHAAIVGLRGQARGEAMGSPRPAPTRGRRTT